MEKLELDCKQYDFCAFKKRVRNWGRYGQEKACEKEERE
jgi:hypothetical protein